MGPFVHKKGITLSLLFCDLLFKSDSILWSFSHIYTKRYASFFVVTMKRQSVDVISLNMTVLTDT